METIKWLMISTGSIAFICVSQGAYAQAAPVNVQSDRVDETAQSGVEDIIVTARRREENLQRTPVAVTAITAEALAQHNITNITQVAAATPSLQLNASAPQSGSSAALTAFIRGIGQLDFTIFTDPGVGIYVDGVYVARSVGSAFDLVDPERIEILRGPQGTLFGRNTIGGAINLVSKAPAADFGGNATLITGSDERFSLNASINAPLSDTFHSKFSLLASTRRGYVQNAFLDERLGNDRTLAGRALFEWKPTSDLTATLALDGTRKRENSAALVLLQASGTGFLDLNGTPRPAGAGNPTLIYAANAALGGVCATNPDSTRSCIGAAWVGAPYTTNDGSHYNSNVDTRGVALTLEQRGNIGLKSITAYRTLKADYGRDSDHTPFKAFESGLFDDQKQFSQELQVSGSVISNRVDYLIGAYYFYEKGYEKFLNLVPNFATNASINLKTTSYAVFGEGTFHIADWLRLTGGLRWSRDDKQFQTDQFFVNGPLNGKRVVTDNGTQRRAFENVTPRVTLSADAMNNLLVYVTYSTGFKSGGFNARYAGAIVPTPISFAPEKTKVYEFGFKYITPNRILRLNADIFQTDYDDIQVNFRPNLTSQLQVIGNAAAARIRGVEAELTLRPTRALHAQASASYLDARYTALGSAVSNISLASKFPYAPEWKLSADVGYDIDIGLGKLTPSVALSYQSKVFYDAVNSTPIAQPGYHLVNAAVAYQSAAWWNLSVGVENLTDTRYLTSGAYSPTLGVAEGIYARSRNWYLRLDAKF